MGILALGRILIASHNAGKIAEFRAMLAPFGIDVVSAADLGLPEPEENGTTFEENAALKSKAAAEASGLPSLADDSGICVHALGGDPGVYTADWAGVPRDFQVARQRVEAGLQAAGAAEPEQRTAHFVCVLSLSFPGGETRQYRGESRGQMVWPARGESTLGFDPVFQPDGYDRTFGEMTVAEKHGLRGEAGGLSHRSRSLSAFLRAELPERSKIYT